MGQITIEIPQNINRNYQIVSESSAQKFLSYLEELIKEETLIEIGETSTPQAKRD
jgi:hypothetical protein